MACFTFEEVNRESFRAESHSSPFGSKLFENGSIFVVSNGRAELFIGLEARN